ncbi:MAG: sensor domain-containing protein [Vulcanimicrobiaceae bacterium]
MSALSAKVAAVLGTMDITTLREVAGSLYADTPDAVVLYDRDGRLVEANEAATLLTGYPLTEFVGSGYRTHVAPADVERVRLAFETALAGGSDHFETCVRHRDGSIIPVECDVFPARLNGRIVGIFAQASDIVALRSAEESLGINQERFRSLFEYHPDGIMELKASGLISRINVALESETGFFGEQVVGKSWTELIAPESREAADEALRSVMRGEAVECDSFLLDRLGNRLDVQLKLVPLHARAKILGAYAIFKNVTPQRVAERAIATQNDRIRRLYLVAASRDKSTDAQIDAALRLGLELFGFDDAYVTQFDGDRVFIRNACGLRAIPEGTYYPLATSLSRHLAGNVELLWIPDMESEEWRNDPARSTAPWRSYLAVQLNVGDGVHGALVFAGRVARHEGIDQREREFIQLMALFVVAALERARQNERIEQMAFNDSLTGLPNRVLFNDRIVNTMATAKRYGRGFAVMYLDLDFFKTINDGYGHSDGDTALKVVAERLQTTLRESDTVARFGGDEFVILQPIVDGPSDAADLARKIHLALQDPVIIDGRAHTVHASIGIALYPSDGSTIAGLMEESDRALYRAKHEGRNRWCFANAEAARRELKKAARRND